MSRQRGSISRPITRAAPRRPPIRAAGRRIAPTVRPVVARRPAAIRRRVVRRGVVRGWRPPGGGWPRRRRPLWLRRRWGWGGPWPFLPDGYPLDDVDSSGVRNLSEPARRSLSRLGLLSGIWQRRLAEAGPELIRFINQFYHVAGVGRVVEDCFAGRYRRAVALMAVRLSYRLTGSDSNHVQNMHFDRLIAFAPDNSPILTIAIGHRGLHYRLFPWREIHGQALRRQLRRDQLTFSSPDKVRWVFSRRAMPSEARLQEQIRQALGKVGGQGKQRWATTLGQTALTV